MKKLFVAVSLTIPMLFGAAMAQSKSMPATHATPATPAIPASATAPATRAVPATPATPSMHSTMHSMNRAPSATERQALHAKKVACKGSIDQSAHGKARKALIKFCMAA